MSKADDAPIVQTSEDFFNVVTKLLHKTNIIHVPQAEINSKFADMGLVWNDAKLSQEFKAYISLSVIVLMGTSDTGRMRLMLHAVIRKKTHYTSFQW